jgi:hypothetical protein
MYITMKKNNKPNKRPIKTLHYKITSNLWKKNLVIYLFVCLFIYVFIYFYYYLFFYFFWNWVVVVFVVVIVFQTNNTSRMKWMNYLILLLLLMLSFFCLLNGLILVLFELGWSVGRLVTIGTSGSNKVSPNLCVFFVCVCVCTRGPFWID